MTEPIITVESKTGGDEPAPKKEGMFAQYKYYIAVAVVLLIIFFVYMWREKPDPVEVDTFDVEAAVEKLVKRQERLERMIKGDQ